MKNIIKGIGLFIAISVLIIVCLDVSVAGTKHNETSFIANSAPYEALRIKLTGEYNLEDDMDLVAELVRNAVINKYSNADLKIQILGIDAENGLLDVNIIQTVKHINGKKTVEEERRTVVVETEKSEENFLFDFNNDNIVDNEDVEYLQRYVDGIGNLSQNQLDLADLNFDGTVNQEDVDIFKEKIENNDSSIIERT